MKMLIFFHVCCGKRAGDSVLVCDSAQLWEPATPGGSDWNFISGEEAKTPPDDREEMFSWYLKTTVQRLSTVLMGKKWLHIQNSRFKTLSSGNSSVSSCLKKRKSFKNVPSFLFHVSNHVQLTSIYLILAWNPWFVFVLDIHTGIRYYTIKFLWIKLNDLWLHHFVTSHKCLWYWPFFPTLNSVTISSVNLSFTAADLPKTRWWRWQRRPELSGFAELFLFET